MGKVIWLMVCVIFAVIIGIRIGKPRDESIAGIIAMLGLVGIGWMVFALIH